MKYKYFVCMDNVRFQRRIPFISNEWILIELVPDLSVLEEEYLMSTQLAELPMPRPRPLAQNDQVLVCLLGVFDFFGSVNNLKS